MNLKSISSIFLILFLGIFAYSCNDDDSSTDVVLNPSENARIYSFSITGKPLNAIDSINYPIMAKVKFAIDQRNNIIYNPDSLPYGTRLAKFSPTISFGASTAAKLEIDYADSIDLILWKSTDSVDFRSEFKLKVTAPSENSNSYFFKLNIHQIDPDTIVWKQLSSIANGGSEQKTLMVNEDFYTLVKETSGIKLYKANKATMSWSAAMTTNLPSTVKVRSLAYLNGLFFAVDNANKGYTSTDGTTWTISSTPKKLYNILGIIPGSTVQTDSLLLMTEDAGKYYFAKTLDMTTVVPLNAVRNSPTKEVPSDFPFSAFSATTNYNRATVTQNVLVLTGGKNSTGELTADTWLLSYRDNRLEVNAATNDERVLAGNEDINNFMYDKSLYAMSNDSLYTSGWGTRWTKSPKKQTLHPQMVTKKGQTVIVDDKNYIWVFGKMNGTALEVWRGRLNRLIK